MHHSVDELNPRHLHCSLYDLDCWTHRIKHFGDSSCITASRPGPSCLQCHGPSCDSTRSEDRFHFCSLFRVFSFFNFLFYFFFLFSFFLFVFFCFFLFFFSKHFLWFGDWVGDPFPCAHSEMVAHHCPTCPIFWCVMAFALSHLFGNSKLYE